MKDKGKSGPSLHLGKVQGEGNTFWCLKKRQLRYLSVTNTLKAITCHKPETSTGHSCISTALLLGMSFGAGREDRSVGWKKPLSSCYWSQSIIGTAPVQQGLRELRLQVPELPCWKWN